MALPTKFMYQVSNWYVEPYIKKLRKYKMRQNRLKNEGCVEKYTAGHLSTKFEEFFLIYKGIIAINEFDLLLAVK